MICRITSVFYSGHLDVELRDWSLAGLEKPSVARLNRLVTAEKSLLAKYLGRLASSDATAIKAAWNRGGMRKPAPGNRNAQRHAVIRLQLWPVALVTYRYSGSRHRHRQSLVSLWAGQVIG